MWIELSAGILIALIFSAWIWFLKRQIEGLQDYSQPLDDSVKRPPRPGRPPAEPEERKPGINTFEIN